MATTQISMTNNRQLIFWSIALLFTCSLAIRCASLDYQRSRAKLDDKTFEFDNQGQKDNEDINGNAYLSGDDLISNGLEFKTLATSNNKYHDNDDAGYIDKIDQEDQKLEPSATSWHYKKSEPQESTDTSSYGSTILDRRSDLVDRTSNNVDSSLDISLARSLWNRLMSHYYPSSTQEDDLEYQQQQDISGNVGTSSKVSDEYNQNDPWKPAEKAGNIYGGIREYPPVSREPQNMLLKSSLQVNSDAHDKYSQQKLDLNTQASINRMNNVNRDAVSNGDEAMMSHLEGYSRNYRLPADYDFGSNEGVQGVNRRPATVTSSNDFYFIVMVAAFCSMAVTVVISAGIFAFRVQQGRKVSSESDYPTYGVVGPSIQSKGPSPYGGGGVSSVGPASKSSGSMKSLADVLSPVENTKNVAGSNSTTGAHNQGGDVGNNPNNQKQYQTNQNAARMYHYQHQKQKMLSTDRVSTTRHASASDLDSDEENDEGTYTVYECPGLASTHEMEVKNPLFQDDPTPVGSPTVTK